MAHTSLWWVFRGLTGVAWSMVIAAILRGNWFWVWIDVFVAAVCLHLSYGEEQ